jgi:hypothetical protein
MLHTNPLLVRSHDFSGEMTLDLRQAWQTPRLYGVGESAGGGAHLVGSLADLPYVLAQAEQDFLVPENTQALIWQELVPTLLLSATLPRWWAVTSNQLHAAALYQRAGEELLAAAAREQNLRSRVMGIVSDGMLPQRSERMELALLSGQVAQVLSEMRPAELFHLAAEFRKRFPGENSAWGEAGEELERLAHQAPEEVSYERMSEIFGAPHPVLTQS